MRMSPHTNRRTRRGVAGTLLLVTALAPPAARADDAALGKVMYQDLCASCHGKDMVSSGVVFDLRKFPRNEPERFRRSVLNGTPKGMPAWQGQLSAEDIQALWDYVKSGG